MTKMLENPGQKKNKKVVTIEQFVVVVRSISQIPQKATRFLTMGIWLCKKSLEKVLSVKSKKLLLKCIEQNQMAPKLVASNKWRSRFLIANFWKAKKLLSSIQLLNAWKWVTICKQFTLRLKYGKEWTIFTLSRYLNFLMTQLSKKCIYLWSLLNLDKFKMIWQVNKIWWKKIKEFSKLLCRKGKLSGLQKKIATLKQLAGGYFTKSL